jgi:hypothetical protein
MRRLGLALAMLVAVLAAVPARAAPLDGSVAGQVSNGTAGAPVPVGEQVILVSIGRKAQTFDQKTAPIDEHGQYTFTGLDRDPDLVYLTAVRHGGVTYPTTQPFQLVDQPSHQADIQVFEPTTSDAALQLPRLNLVVAGAQPGMLQMMEMGAVVNGGDRTFLTDNPQDQALAHGLRFALPRGALGAQFQTGFDNRDVVSSLDGVQVTGPVPPGQHEFALSFQLPYSGSDADLSLQAPYPVGSFTLYLPQGGPRLSSASLAPQGAATLGGQTYQVYTAQNAGAGTRLDVHLAELPSTAGLTTSQLALISLGVAVLVLGGGLLLFGQRRRHVPAPAPAGDPEAERLQLVVRLAALDERYASGGIGEREYATERNRGKQRLLELTALSRPTAQP